MKSTLLIVIALVWTMQAAASCFSTFVVAAIDQPAVTPVKVRLTGPVELAKRKWTIRFESATGELSSISGVGFDDVIASLPPGRFFTSYEGEGKWAVLPMTLWVPASDSPSQLDLAVVPGASVTVDIRSAVTDAPWFGIAALRSISGIHAPTLVDLSRVPLILPSDGFQIVTATGDVLALDWLRIGDRHFRLSGKINPNFADVPWIVVRCTDKEAVIQNAEFECSVCVVDTAPGFFSTCSGHSGSEQVSIHGGTSPMRARTDSLEIRISAYGRRINHLSSRIRLPPDPKNIYECHISAIANRQDLEGILVDTEGTPVPFVEVPILLLCNDGGKALRSFATTNELGQFTLSNVEYPLSMSRNLESTSKFAAWTHRDSDSIKLESRPTHRIELQVAPISVGRLVDRQWQLKKDRPAQLWVHMRPEVVVPRQIPCLRRATPVLGQTERDALTLNGVLALGTIPSGRYGLVVGSPQY